MDMGKKKQKQKHKLKLLFHFVLILFREYSIVPHVFHVPKLRKSNLQLFCECVG